MTNYYILGYQDGLLRKSAEYYMPDYDSEYMASYGKRKRNQNKVENIAVGAGLVGFGKGIYDAYRATPEPAGTKWYHPGSIGRSTMRTVGGLGRGLYNAALWGSAAYGLGKLFTD